MRILIPAVIASFLSLVHLSEAAEVWTGTGAAYTGDKDKVFCDNGRCVAVDTRISGLFELEWHDEEGWAYFSIGGLRGEDEEGSYTFIGGGVHVPPFPQVFPWFTVQAGAELGEKTVHSDKALRFKVCTWGRVHDLLRLGWCYRSNGRSIFNLGSDRNEKIKTISLQFCAAGCK